MVQKWLWSETPEWIPLLEPIPIEDRVQCHSDYVPCSFHMCNQWQILQLQTDPCSPCDVMVKCDQLAQYDTRWFKWTFLGRCPYFNKSQLIIFILSCRLISLIWIISCVVPWIAKAYSALLVQAQLWQRSVPDVFCRANQGGQAVVSIARSCVSWSFMSVVENTSIPLIRRTISTFIFCWVRTCAVDWYQNLRISLIRCADWLISSLK